ncbi:teichoic acid biosynthesis protein C [Streptomyces sp. NPDC012950]|uniref:phage baseplate protein n=1 Tax=Streptomyces sp. NPDC012950 TaxID=3364858 RepID=UPI0036AB2D5E
MPRSLWGRRTFLRAGGAAIAGTTFGISTGSAAAAIPTSERFDLATPSHDLYRAKPLHDDTVQQGFAFDNTNRRLFVAQRRNGTAEGSGDLCVSRLDFGGRQLGFMHLQGFGHGVSFGAEAVGTATYLWMETDANDHGYGRRLARFAFTDGKTLSANSTGLRKFTPVAAASEHTCAVDPVHERLIVRFHQNGAKHIAVYSLAAAAEGNFSAPLARFPQPDLGARKFQGYTGYGSHLYMLTGHSYPETGDVVDSEVTSVNMNTGTITQGPLLTSAGSTLPFREPEGMAVYRTAGGEVRLFLGFASGEPGDRRSNLFFKNVLV